MSSSGGVTISGADSVTIPTCIAEPSSSQGTWVPLSFAGEGSGYPFGGGAIFNSSAAIGDYLEYPIVVAAGTWSMSVYLRQSSNVGDTTLTIDGVSVGVVPGYALAPAYKKSTFAGVHLLAGVRLVRLAQATKNASSSGYAGGLFGVGMVRTGA